MERPMELPLFTTEWKFFKGLQNMFYARSERGGITFPDFNVFDNLSSFMKIDEQKSNYIKKQQFGDPNARGKAGAFYKLDEDYGMKIMKKHGALDKLTAAAEYTFTNIEDVSYQSLGVTDAPYSAIDYFQRSGTTQKIIIDVPSSPFYNQTYIHSVLQLILDREQLAPFNKMYIKQIYAGVYEDDDRILNGVTVMKLSKLGTLYDFLEALPEEKICVALDDIISNLLEILMYLKSGRFLFCHNDLKTKNIFVNEENGKIYYQIADYDKSSISYMGYRFRHTNNNFIQQNIGITGLDFEGSPTYKIIDSAWMSGQIIGSFGVEPPLTAYIMHSKIYYLSYDIYTMMVSIFLHHKVSKYCKAYIDELLPLMFPNSDNIKAIQEAVGRASEYSLPGRNHNDNPYNSIAEITKLLSKMDLLKTPEFLSKRFGVTSIKDYNKTYIVSGRKELIGSLKIGADTGMLGSYAGKEHICTSECIKGECFSNKYSKSGYFPGQRYEHVKSSCKN